MQKKILIIVSKINKDFRHLYSLVDAHEYKAHKEEIIKFYDYKKELLKDMKNENYHFFIKNIQDFYGKENVFIFNQEVDNKMQEMDIAVTNLHGNITNKKENNEDYDIILKNEDGKYEELIKKIDETHLLLFIGNLGNADPSLFIEEMTHSIYINEEEEFQNNTEKITTSSFFDEKIMDDLNKSEVGEILFNKIKNIINKEEFIINIENPFQEENDFIENKIDEYILDLKKKYNLPEIDTNLGKKIKIIYPFLKKYPDVFVENMWYAFCTDTDNIKKMDEPFDTSLFYDLILVYVLYKWEGIKKTLYKTPKISLLESYLENNSRNINIFKNLLFKQENSLINNIK